MSLESKGEGLTAVLLLNLGGPDSLNAVRPFLFNLFSDKEIIRLPFQPILARFISARRAKKVISRYAQIGGKSPLLDLTNGQAQALEKELNSRSKTDSKGPGFKVYVGMRYWHPFIEETVEQIQKDGIKKVVALSLFPHYSRATTGSCFKELKRVLKRNPNLEVVYVDHWFDNPTYLDTLAQKINETLAEFPAKNRKRIQIVFTAHSLPQDFIDQGDPYLDHLKRTIEGLRERLRKISWHLAFQSRSGPVKWMKPSTEKVLENLAHDGYREILMVPISFVSDHVETLYEIDIMYRDLAESKGIVIFKRSPSLNSSPKFIEALAEIVEKALNSSKGLRVKPA